MAGLAELRKNKLQTVEVLDENDNVIRKSLRFKL
jgi:hypothetical protein